MLRLHIHHIRIPAHRLSIQTRPKPLQIPLLPPHAVPTRHPRVLTQNSGSGNSVCPSESSVVDDPSVTPVPVPMGVCAEYDGGSDHTFAGRETPFLGPGPCAKAVVERARAPEGRGEGWRDGGARPDAGEVGWGWGGVLGGDVDAAEFGVAVGRECLSTLVDEERAGAVRRDDTETAKRVGDEPDEAARREHARRHCRHVRLEVLQGAHLGRDHAAQRLRPVCVHPFVGQRRFVIQRIRCWRFLIISFCVFFSPTRVVITVGC